MGVRSTDRGIKGVGANKFLDGYLTQFFNTRRTGGGTNFGAAGIVATGGVISDYTTAPGTVYRAHIFTSSGTFSVSEIGNYGSDVDYLVVAGGGGGGGATGGGGAGGLRTNLSGHPLAGSAFSVSTSPGSYTVTVGGGGAAGGGSSILAGGSGGNSAFSEITSTGGGGGAPPGGNPGGSGGGGVAGGAGGTGNTPPTSPPQGNPGGAGGTSSTPTYYPGGGGGGAGGAGGSSPNSAGTGGIGSQVLIGGPPATTQPIGTPGPNPGGGYFAGGGGGATYGGQAGGVGGAGGGGTGKTSGAGGSAGTYATGGGGGGAGSTRPQDWDSFFAHNGGSGIVVVRYQIGQLTATAKATGGAISYYDGKTIHTFTSSGTFVNTSGSPLSAEYVIVAGGGGGKAGSGGGGGAGGYITGPVTVPTSPITVQVGAGGNWRSDDGGTPSYFGTPITAYGGGSGVQPSMPGPSYANGGSGGGGHAGPGPSPYNTAGLGSRQTSTTSPTPISPQGNPGGTANGGPDFNSAAGGGGGAGGAGGNAGPNVAGNGGVGVQVPTTFRNPESAPTDTTNPQPSQRGGGLGTPGPAGEFYLAGGGGGGYDGRGGGPTGGSGGSGGGGGASVTGTPGLVNTGGGGGGSHAGYTSPTDAGNGGSGIVLIAYPS